MPRIRCPQCRQECEYSPNNPFRPFCSQRCRQIDLGEWVDETYRVASEEPLSEGDLLNLLEVEAGLDAEDS